MLVLDDVKVFMANVVCYITINIPVLNSDLQTLVLLSTIVYTIVRTVNEIKRFTKKRHQDATDKKL